MAFFRNDAVNRINLHFGIESFAGGMGGVFTLAFLLHAGVSVALTLATFFAVIVVRFTLRPAIVPFGKRLGLKPMVIAGALVMAAQFPLLAEVRGLDGWLVAFALAQAIGDIIYWPSYHAYFAALGDAEHRGDQIGIRGAISAGVGIVAPLVGTWALLNLGPRAAFGLAAAIQALSAWPLLAAPNVAVPPKAASAGRGGRFGIAIFVADGGLAASFYFVWQVALFVSLGDSLAAFGGAVALAALVGAVAGLVLGRFVDLGHGRRATIVAYAATAAVAVLRAFSLGTPWLAVVGNALGSLVGGLVAPAIMAPVYNLAKASADPFRYHVASEAGWDIGCGAGCLIAAVVAALGGSLVWPLLLALPCLVATAWLLWRYYGDHPEPIGPDLLAATPPAYLAESHPPP
ncbi:MAG TPA: hypothetical protein VME40_19505 [Caulobacteraceae bacterium]|nr:hypothetical protein [Caulobacteraceae bacterium]